MSIRQYIRRAWPLYVMIVPGVIFVLLFRYYPMYGVVIAFQDFSPAKGFAGSPWIGWENFEFFFSLPEFRRIFSNTLIISISKIVADQVGAIILALLLNEARRIVFRRVDSDDDLSAAFPVLDRAGRDFAGYPFGGRHTQSSD